ncbi:1-deoxy-D-xylulose-5-phosphate reductoisomerase [Gemmatimonadota bacterium]
MMGIAILGSTGSIGVSTLEVVERHPDRFRVVALAANRSVDALAAQVARHTPLLAVIVQEEIPAGQVGSPETRWARGQEALLELVDHPDVDVVVNALVGAVGLEPTLQTLHAGKRLAVANKESLVAGGPLVIEAAKSPGAELVPIDSEHSAILQCMQGYDRESVARVVLTASGGPFRGWTPEALREVKPSDALQHPTWSMGAKITVDSATLANKALEVIEAHFLYGLEYGDIEVVVHPQSIIHSFVEFVDGSVLAQVGFPTMEIPILYALSYPDRVGDESLRTFDAVRSSPLTFEDVDRSVFTLFSLGVSAGKEGGTAPAVFNASNEIAVEAFLGDLIRFTEMGEVVGGTLDRVPVTPVKRVEDVLNADSEARRIAREIVAIRSDGVLSPT